MEAINFELVETAKYSRANVMETAWYYVKTWGYSLSESMQKAWIREKNRAAKVYRKLNPSEKAIINGNKTPKITTWKPTQSEQQALHNWYHQN
jgi:hypothetical protein